MDLGKVQDHLLAELDRLEGLTGDELKSEINRAHAMVDVAGQINGTVANQIAVTRLVVQTRNEASEMVVSAVDRLIGLPGAES